MQNSNIWTKILLIGSIFLFLFGAVMTLSIVLLPDTAALMYTFLYGGTLSADVNTMKYINILLGLTGAIMLGWGSMATYLSYKLLSDENELIWNAFTISLIIWYIEDSFVSLWFDATMNVVLNTGFLILFLIPILGRKYK